MYLEGQGNQRGYAMAALLVSIGVMMVLMSVALPVWRHEVQREKEAELIFRGEQYARAIYLYQRKAGPGNFPPSIDLLVQQRFLRKKYKDPITDGDFQIIPVAAGIQQGQAQPGQQSQRGTARGRDQSATGGSSQTQGRSSTQPPARSGGPGQFGAGGAGGSGQSGARSSRGQLGAGSGQFVGEGGQVGGGIMGVVSKSKETSIRVYHGGTHYDQWTFLFSNMSNRPGGAGGQGAPGVPGGQRGNGGRGGPRGGGGQSAPGMPGGGLGRPGGGRGVGPGGVGPGGAGMGRGPGGQ
jgi:type II secretory pathway pseudopilin PulG